MNEPYIKFMRNPEAVESILRKNTNAFILLSVVAQRARRTPSPDGLQPGQCYLGDHASYGLTRSASRTAIKSLLDGQFLAIKTTNRGTIATLIDSSIYDLNIEEVSQQHDQQIASKSPTDEKKIATNKNVIKKECKNGIRDIPPTIEQVQEYAKEVFPELDCQYFIDYYTARGWMIGKSKMKDWQACVRTWKSNRKPQQGKQPHLMTSKVSDTEYERMGKGKGF